MPVAWSLRDSLLTLSVSGLVTDEEIDRAIDEALADAPSARGLRLLWDARQAQAPVTSDEIAWRINRVSSLAERGVLARAALLLDSRHQLILEAARQHMAKAVPAMPLRVFSDASEAAAWLRE